MRTSPTPGWTPTGPADQTQMLLELFAERLDRIAYRQELAPSEGTLPTALENVINRLVVDSDDEDFGEIPRPSPTLVRDLGRLN